MKHVDITKWEFCGYWNYVPEMKSSAELGEEMAGVTDFMDAQVPGSVYTDLVRHGVILDPSFEMNSLLCEWVSNRWWVYRGKFYLDEKPSGEKLELYVGGIDYAARFYVNNVLLGRHEGAFIPVHYDITAFAAEGENTVCVMLEHAPFVHAQIGYTSEVDRYKSRYNCKWDFSTRLVGIGIYDEIFIRIIDKAHIKDTHCRPIREGDAWRAESSVCVSARCLGEYKTVFRLCYEGGEIFTKEQAVFLKEGDNTVTLSAPVDSPRLWYPAGYGKAELYHAQIHLYFDDVCQDTVCCNLGFREVSYERTEGAPMDALPYMPVVNGVPVYIKGVNVVPPELYLNMDDEAACSSLLRDVKEGNMNLVRVWGGGMIASEHFYNICDRLGIMVWQEFLMSSSGCDNIPSKREPFLSQLLESAGFFVRQKRNHPSLFYWSGGNELSDERYRNDKEKKWTPATFDDSTLSKLREIVQLCDPDRLMLPTSASGPLENLDPLKPGQNHDVHGPWKYMGERDHYTLYNTSDSMLHSEFGCDGMSELQSLKKFLIPENLRFTTARDNLIWRHHGEWWDTYFKREQPIFGDFSPDELETYIKCSQYMQAEGLRYAVEANRRRRPRNCGSIIWQLNEPWPNVYCTNLVDYYGQKKLAYYFVAEAYAPTTPTLTYDSFTYACKERFNGEVSICSDLPQGEGTVECTLEYNGAEAVLLKKKFHADGYTTAIGSLDFAVPDKADCFVVHIHLYTSCKHISKSYMFLIRDAETQKCSRSAVCQYYDRYMSNFIGKEAENIHDVCR